MKYHFEPPVEPITECIEKEREKLSVKMCKLLAKEMKMEFVMDIDSEDIKLIKLSDN